MKKPTSSKKPLQLASERIRTLTAGELQAAAGAGFDKSYPTSGRPSCFNN